MTDERKKIFVVPTSWMNRRLRHILSAVGTVNHRKIGRTRRGQVMLAGVDGSPLEGVDATLVTVTLRRNKFARAMVPTRTGYSVQRFMPYQHHNVAKVLKDLASAHARRERQFAK